jgi:hypothetical protein
MRNFTESERSGTEKLPRLRRRDEKAYFLSRHPI